MSKEVFIGEVDSETPSEKKKKLTVKSKIIVGSALGVVVFGSVFVMYSSPSGPTYFQVHDPGISLDPLISDKDLWRQRQQENLSEISKQISSLAAVIKKQESNIGSLKENVKKTHDRLEKEVQEKRELKAQLEKTKKELESKIKSSVVNTSTPIASFVPPVKDNSGSSENIPSPKAKDDKKQIFAGFKMPDPKASPDDINDVPPPPVNPFATVKKKTSISYGSSSVKKDKAKKAKIIEKDMGSDDGILVSGISQSDANKFVQQKIKATKTLKKSPFAGRLPAGSFAQIAVISGLDAGASSETQKNPMPVMMRIQSDAIVPSMHGKVKYKLKGCFLMGSAYGDISSERVMIRPTRLTCLDAHRKLMLSASVSGAIMDFDNSLGLRGKVDYRDGARIAKSIMASSASSLAQIAALGSGVSTATLSSGLTADGNGGGVKLPSAGQLGMSAGLNAFSSSIDIIAKRYADQAKEIHPVIVLPGGRKGSVTFTKGVNLKWNRYDAIYQETINPTTNKVPGLLKGGLVAK